MIVDYHTALIILYLCVVINLVFGQRSFLSSYNDLIRQNEKESRFGFTIRYPYRAPDRSRKQPIFPDRLPFPCANTTAPGIGRSRERPSSVHRLRPGDIDVIGAMGDSLIAGNGAMEDWAMGNIIEYRGISWAAGGQGTWREYLTVPNILKEYNKNLTGYSTGTGELLSRHSRLNVAFPVSADADAYRQAKILVTKMQRDRRINIKQDWKMITIFFGANDLCSAQCYDTEQASPHNHARKLAAALDYLQDNLPRTFVNLIPVIDVTVSVRVKRSMMCHLLHRLYCACFHQGGDVDEMDYMMRTTREYQEVEENLVTSGRYYERDDFTVVMQPFMKLFNAKDDPVHRYDEVIDISYITHDCFHFSQKGHALSANLLWNNLMEPVGAKSTKRLNYILEEFKCPSAKHPYLFTYKNSKAFLETGNQT